MADDDWKQSAVMVYAASSILSIVCLTSCILYSLFKNEERRQRVKRALCYLCITDPMVGYDTVRKGDGENDPFIPSNNMFSIDDEEDIDVPLNLEMQAV